MVDWETECRAAWDKMKSLSADVRRLKGICLALGSEADKSFDAVEKLINSVPTRQCTQCGGIDKKHEPFCLFWKPNNMLNAVSEGQCPNKLHKNKDGWYVCPDCGLQH